MKEDVRSIIDVTKIIPANPGFERLTIHPEWPGITRLPVVAWLISGQDLADPICCDTTPDAEERVAIRNPDGSIWDEEARQVFSSLEEWRDHVQPEWREERSKERAEGRSADIHDFIKQAGVEGRTYRQIQRKFRGVQAADLQKILKGMPVMVEVLPTAGGGPAMRIYRSKRPE